MSGKGILTAREIYGNKRDALKSSFIPEALSAKMIASKRGYFKQMIIPIIAHTIHLLFLCYTILLFVRVTSSWFPAWRHTTFIRFVAHYTDPYLNLFRKFIPPIGGVMDLSPLIAYIVLQIVEKIIIAIIT